MSEQYNTTQLREALATINNLDSLVARAGAYIIENMRAGKEEAIIVDREVVEAMRGGVRGLYNELVDRDKQAEARAVIDDNPLAYW